MIESAKSKSKRSAFCTISRLRSKLGLYCGEVVEISQPLLPIGIKTPSCMCLASHLRYTGPALLPRFLMPGMGKRDASKATRSPNTDTDGSVGKVRSCAQIQIKSRRCAGCPRQVSFRPASLRDRSGRAQQKSRVPGTSAASARFLARLHRPVRRCRVGGRHL